MIDSPVSMNAQPLSIKPPAFTPRPSWERFFHASLDPSSNLNATVDGGPLSPCKQAANANANAPRAPSAILGAVAVSQLQFIATLSLVDNTGGEDSSLPGFADSFRYA